MGNVKGVKGHSAIRIQWRKIDLIVFFIIILACCSKVHAVSDDIPCEGYGDEQDDTCPIGMYCNEPSGGTCQDCDHCGISQVVANTFISKCRCRGEGPFTTKFCKVVDRTGTDEPIIYSLTDLRRYGLELRYQHIYNGSHNSLNCATPSFTPTHQSYITQPSTQSQQHSTTLDSTLSSLGENTSSVGTTTKDDYTEKRCRDLEAPVNGSILQSNTGIGGSTLFRCDDGYTMKGKEEQMCRKDGWYPDQSPICVKDAAALISTQASMTTIVIIVTVSCAVAIVIVMCICCYFRKKGRCCTDIEDNRSVSPTPLQPVDNSQIQQSSVLLLDDTSTKSSSSDSASDTSGERANSAAAFTENETDSDEFQSTDCIQLKDRKCSSTQGFCDCKLSMTTWAVLTPLLQSLLDDKAFRETFVKMLFQCADETTKHTITVKSCLRTAETNFIEAIKDGMETFGINTYRSMADVLYSLELRDEYAEKKQEIATLLAYLSSARQDVKDCTHR